MALLSTLVLAVSVLAPTITTLASSPGSASTVGTLNQRAAALATRVNAAETKLDILSEEYDQAQARQSALAKQISNDKGDLFAAQHSVQLDNVALHRQAVNAYVDSGSSQGLSAILSSSANVLPLQQTYLGIASSSLDDAVVSLKDAEHQLTVRTTTLEQSENEAAAATTAVGSSQQQAASIENELAATLANVKGSLAAQVAQQERQQEETTASTDQAGSLAAQAAAATASEGGVSGTIAATSTAVSGDDPGALALDAARTQLGVPYVWAGATPGEGFDCSGFTMWAWSKAGVNLPHSAEEQYEEVEHIPFSELQPGDLIFYASDGYVYHVIMYAGNGEAIQALDTGTVIQYTPVWPGAIGAGRP